MCVCLFSFFCKFREDPLTDVLQPSRGRTRRPQVASSLFLAHNTALVPPYRVLIDTNFINFSLQNKLELVEGMMDCLYAKCEPFVSIVRPWIQRRLGIPCVTDCVMAELEKLGHRYRVALR